MATHKSAEKRARQTITRTLRNRVRTSQSRNLIKAIRIAIEKSDKEAAKSLLPQCQAKLDRLAKHGVIKANTAARRSSRLAQQVAKLG